MSAEIARLNVLITDLQRNSSTDYSTTAKTISNTDAEALAEARAALETERAGAARLEQALAVALKDNAALAVKIHAEDVAPASGQPPSPKDDRSAPPPPPHRSAAQLHYTKRGSRAPRGLPQYKLCASNKNDLVSVVGPRILRPYSPYRVAVAGGPRAQSLYVAIEGRRANGEQFQQGREVQVQPGSSRLVDLDVGEPGPGQYSLVASSTSGPHFASSAPLIYQARSFCVFIQTDKRVYQPQDTIYFRVIALDKYLLGLSGVVDVTVRAAGGAAVRQWAGLSLDRGLLALELPLADQPALGQWTIEVEVRGQTYSRQVLVADYVMPKFHMDIQMPKEILFKDGRFVVNVTAKHFNGLPVRGELTLSSYAVFFSGVLQPIFSSPSRKVIDFNGQTEVTYDLKTDLDLAEDAARPLVVEAVLEEKDTLIKQNVSARILLLRTSYRLRVTAPEHFKPELPYNVQIEVVDSSGQVMSVDDEVSVERLWDDGAPVNVTTLQLKGGLATYTLVPDKAHASSRLNLVVKYKEVSERVINVQQSAPSGGQFLTIELLSRGSVGDEMRARISATEPMDLLNYAVIGRGDILHTKTLELSPARKSVDIKVPVTSAMAPGSILLAWYPRLDPIVNTVVASAMLVPQDNLLQYEVSVSVSGAGRPGGGVELQVSGEAGAHAAVLAQDARAIAAGLAGEDGRGSGLTMKRVTRLVSGAGRPAGAVSLQVRGEAGAHAAVLAQDARAVAAGLAGGGGTRQRAHYEEGRFKATRWTSSYLEAVHSQRGPREREVVARAQLAGHRQRRMEAPGVSPRLLGGVARPGLHGQVSVSVSGAGRPAGAVSLLVRGEAGAHAAVLAQDARAVAAGLAGGGGGGSGLTMKRIEREVESFIGVKHSVFKNEDHQPFKGLDLGGNTTAEVFQNAGVVILTDGIVIRGNAREEHSPEPETGTRPPLAGPYAFSRLPTPPSPRYYLTVNPQPTWLRANFSIRNDGKGQINRQTPITSGEWSVGAFAIHPNLGLGLASPKKFTTSVALSISAELPASLQKGETIAAVVTLTSSLSVDTAVEVTFHNSEQYFEFEPLENSVEASKKIELFRRLRVTVPANGLASTAFLVTVVRGGEAPVIVEASGTGVSASLFRTIDVQDGYEEELWSWILLDGRRSTARGNVTLDAQAGTRLGGASLKAAGDLLAPALHASRAAPPPAADPASAVAPLAIAAVLLDYLQSTLGRLLVVLMLGGASLMAAGDLLAPALHASRAAPPPAADPATAVAPLAIAAVLLDYLQATNRDDDIALTTEARAQAEMGYQRLMAYRQPDGSFAAEISDDAQGDVFMTATATRWLSRSARYVPVSPSAAESARWLVQQQETDGSWRPPPPPARHAPRAQQTAPLTAHALMALLAVQSVDALHKNAINKAVDYIARALSDELDAYSLAVVANALAMTRHPQASKALQLLEPHTNGTGSERYWSRQLSGSEWRNPWLRHNSAEASTAAWGLRAMLAANLVDQALPVARFLLAATKPGTLDPDVLESLSQMAQLIKTSTNMRVSANVTGSEEPRQFNIDDDNALIIQTQLVRNVRAASARTEGRGLAVLGVAARGSTNVTAAWPRYTLDPRVDAVSTRDRLQLSICVGFVPQGNETISGLTLLTVQLPSGYLADIHTLTELKAAPHVSSARLAAGGARVLAWLRALQPRERCATLAAPRALPVARQRPGHATLRDVYDDTRQQRERCATLAAPRALPVARQRPGHATLRDLYDDSHRARVFFQPITAHACDVCREWASCARACGTTAERRAADTAADAPPAAPGASHGIVPATALVVIGVLLSLR
ncbi:unnamed protein product [Plutella xylostella]|uniref:(diamondback moth) hypothetical protein n=1 Tax=Plutella xylostella TaxID=51655 RepID=A0A8S4DIK0_PLUXY|nr:unnamed protein product [Plutella xylostella]